jgi:hypothetical protein
VAADTAGSAKVYFRTSNESESAIASALACKDLWIEDFKEKF